MWKGPYIYQRTVDSANAETSSGLLLFVYGQKTFFFSVDAALSCIVEQETVPNFIVYLKAMYTSVKGCVIAATMPDMVVIVIGI